MRARRARRARFAYVGADVVLDETGWETIVSLMAAEHSLCQEVGDFSVTGNGFSVARLRILPKCVLAALPPQYATMPAEMPEQSLALHPTTTNSCLASGGRARKDSSRL